MDAKKILTNKSFCPLPWTGFFVQQNGDVKNCVLSKKIIGNVDNNSIEEILAGEKNLNIKKAMLADQQPSSCVGCYQLEKNKKKLDIVSQRIYYIKELRHIDPLLYNQINNFNLHTVDIRWTNQCNQACVYCGPHNSTLWEKETVPYKTMSKNAKQAVRDFIFNNVEKLKNVYLAGGEPTLMNENQEFLNLLLEKNPNVTLRVNTNLNNIHTKVATLIRRFKNVHWIVSVEAIGEAYEYIRYGGSWTKFNNSLLELKQIPNHKISFNMLFFILNYQKLFECIDYLKGLGFHNNSFIIGPLYTPEHLNILNLPQEKINECKQLLKTKIGLQPGYFLEDSYQNLLSYLETKFEKRLDYSYKKLKELDIRRKLDSKKIFKEIYD